MAPSYPSARAMWAQAWRMVRLRRGHAPNESRPFKALAHMAYQARARADAADFPLTFSRLLERAA